MATQNMTYGVNVTDNGTTKKVVKDVKELRQTIDETTGAIKQMQAQGEKRWQAAARSAGAPTGSQALMSGEEYGRARGSAGTTGASARDFANQAQGLGGLVRLYATFAANIFAVTAAFRGLSNAMDTTNMIKGLDQLGAASGMALGSLSKRLVETTDGAVSLREAMQATAKATAAGLSSEQVLRLGKVAKQASQALGVDMQDALSRVSRGVTKLEPELLDELGIFTKVDQASRDYARSIGKTAEQLTDFEKRMAFANAVLTEGEKKFNAINVDVNPYTKLAAALSDTLQRALEQVNRVLAPFIKLLAESPTGLLTAVAAISAVLVKQALPTIGQFKQGLQLASDQAKELAKQKGEQAIQAQKFYDKEITRLVEARADAEIQRVDAAEKKVLGLKQASISKQTVAYQVLQKDIKDVDAADMARLDKSIERAKRAGKTKEADVYKEVKDSILAAQKEEENLKQTKEKLRKEVAEGAKGWGVYATVQDAAQKAQVKAAQSAIVSNAAYNGGLIGITKSIRLMVAEINNSEVQLGKVAKAATVVRGTFAAVAGAVTTLASRLGTVGMVVGAIIGTAEFINSIFTKSAEAAGEFKKSVENLDSASKNLRRTMDTLWAGSPFAVTSLEAQARAMMEVASSFDKFTSSAEAAQKAVNFSGWDRFWDRIFSFFGGGVQGNFEKALGTSILAAIEDLENSPIQTRVKENLQNILRIKDIDNFDELKKKLEGLAPGSEQVKQIKQVLRDAAIEAGNAASKSREFVDAQTKASETFKDLTRQFQLSDPIVRFANDNLTAMLKLDTVLKGPVKESLGALVKTITEVGDKPIFGVKASAEIAGLQEEVLELNKEFEGSAKLTQALQARLADLKKNKFAEGPLPLYDNRAEAVEVRDQITAVKAELEKAKLAEAKLAGRIAEVSGKVRQSIIQGIGSSIDTIAVGMRAALQKGVTENLQNLYTGIDIVPQLAQRQFELKKEELQNDIKIIEGQAAIARSNYELKASLDVLNTGRALAEAVKRVETAAPADKAAAETAKNAADAQAAAAKLAQEMITEGWKNPLKVIEQVNEQVKKTPELAAYSQNIIAAVQGATAFAAQINQTNRAIQSTDFSKQQVFLAAQQKQARDILETERQSNKLNLEMVEQQQQRGQLSFEEYKRKRLALAQFEIEQEYQAAIAADRDRFAQDELKAQQLVKAALGTNKEAQAKLDANRLLAESRRISDQKQSLALRAKANASERENTDIINKGAEELRRQAQFSLSILQTEQTIAKVREDSAITLQEIALRRAEETESLPPEVLQQRRAQLEIAKEEQGFRQQVREAETAFQAQQIQNGIELNRLLELGNKLEADRLIQRIQLDGQLHNTRLDQIEAEKNARIASIDAVQKYREEREDFSRQTEAIRALDNVYEGLGTKLADVYTITDKRNKLEERNTKAITDQEAKVNLLASAGEDTTDEVRKLNKLRERSAKDQLMADAQLIGSAKKLFSEKTGAYKALAAIEKVMYLTRLAMDAKELAMKLGFLTAGTTAKIAAETTETAVTEAGFLARSATYITEIFAKFTAMMGPYGTAAAAIAVAAIFAGRGGGTKMPVVTSEQRQQTQGTAMGYNAQGEQVQVRRGVFGDTGAKSESIERSLEIIADNSIIGLDYNNKMLIALRNLKDSIENAAKGSIGIAGVQRGTAFGTQTGVSTSGIASWLFGKTTSTQIVDSGIQLKGSFLDLANAVQGTVKQFEVVQTTVTRSGFLGFGGRTSTYTATNYADLVGEQLQAFSRVFGYGREVLIATAEMAGKTASTVDAALANIRVDEMASLRGLTGEAFVKELSSVFSAVMDDAAYAIFKSFEQFAKFGEGMLETVTRVVDTNKKIEQQLKNIGFKGIAETLQEIGVEIYKVRAFGGFFGLGGFTLTREISRDEEVIKQAAYKITESLATISGGLDQFLDKTQYFEENFLTKQERLATVTSAVNKELTRLGFSTNLSRDQFKQLVQVQDLTSQSGRETFVSLLNLQEGLLEVIEAQEELAQSASDAADKIKQEAASLNTELLRALGKTLELRAEEVAKLDQTNQLVKVRIYALEDLAKYEQELASVQDKVASIQKEATSGVVQANQKYLDAQKAIADLAVEAAKKMRDFGKSLRQFVQEQSGLGIGGQTTQNIRTQFEQSVQRALQGSEQDIQGLQTLATSLIESVRGTSRTYLEFTQSRQQILTAVSKVADYAEIEAAKTTIPVTDPLAVAQENLRLAKQQYDSAVSIAQQIGAPLSEASRDLVAEFTKANKQAIVLETAIGALKGLLETIATNTGANGGLNSALIAIGNNTGINDGALTYLKSIDGINADVKKAATDTAINTAKTGTLGTGLEASVDVSDAIGSTLAEGVNALQQVTAAGSAAVAGVIAEQNNSTLVAIANNTGNTNAGIETSLRNQQSMIGYLSQIATSTGNLASKAATTSGGSGGSSGGFFDELLGLGGSIISGALNIITSPISWARKRFSDARTKENISYVRTLNNGLNLYDFNYKAPYNAFYGTDTKRGVIAQEVVQKYPGAVSTDSADIMSVDYTQLGQPSGVFKFAKGGVFGTPTNFSLGLMAEAGPEAIMPLARDSAGRLGVSTDIKPVADYTQQTNRELIQELQQLRQEVQYLRAETRATATNTNKTVKILDRVTQNGDSLTVTIDGQPILVQTGQ